MANVKDYSYFNSNALQAIQIWCYKVHALLGISWIVMTYAISIPGYGWALGFLMGIACYYVGKKKNFIILKGNKLKEEVQVDLQRVSISEIFLSFIAVLIQVTTLFVGSYTGYMVLGKQLGWPLPESSFQAMGIIFGGLCALGASITISKLFLRYWTVRAGKLEADSTFWEGVSFIANVLSSVDSSVLTCLAFNLMIPGGGGLILGIIMGLSSFFIGAVTNYVALIQEKQSKANEALANLPMTYVSNWKTKLYPMGAFLSILIVTVNAFVWTYIGYVALGTAVAVCPVSIFAVVGIICGGLSATSTCIYNSSLSERFYNWMRKYPIVAPKELEIATISRESSSQSAVLRSVFAHPVSSPQAANEEKVALLPKPAAPRFALATNQATHEVPSQPEAIQKVFAGNNKK